MYSSMTYFGCKVCQMGTLGPKYLMYESLPKLPQMGNLYIGTGINLNIIFGPGTVSTWARTFTSGKGSK